MPVLTPEGSPYDGLCAGPGQTLWYTLLAADRIGRITLGGRVEEFPRTDLLTELSAVSAAQQA